MGTKNTLECGLEGVSESIEKAKEHLDKIIYHMSKPSEFKEKKELLQRVSDLLFARESLNKIERVLKVSFPDFPDVKMDYCILKFVGLHGVCNHAEIANYLFDNGVRA